MNHILITRRNSTLLVLMRPVEPPVVFAYGFYLGKSTAARERIEGFIRQNRDALLKHFSVKYGKKLKDVILE